MAMHARKPEVMQGTETKPCSHPQQSSSTHTWEMEELVVSSQQLSHHSETPWTDPGRDPVLHWLPGWCILTPEPCSDASLNPLPLQPRTASCKQAGAHAPLAQLSRALLWLLIQPSRLGSRRRDLGVFLGAEMQT